MNKTLSLILAILMIFTLCACDADKESAPSTSTTPQTSTNATTTPDSTANITEPSEDELIELTLNDVVPDSITYWSGNQWKDGVFSIIDFDIEEKLSNS